MTKCTERFEDMSEKGRLRVWQQDDGDMVVSIIPDPSQESPGCSVEFCSSGGRSHRTLAALRELMAAMHADNCDPTLTVRQGKFSENMPATAYLTALVANARIAGYIQGANDHATEPLDQFELQAAAEGDAIHHGLLLA